MHSPKVQARLKLLTPEEGGRETPFIASYRPQFHFDGEVEGWVVEIVHCEPNPFPPGAEGMITLIFTSYDRLKDRLTPGTKIQIKEGFRTLGQGEITGQIT